ncbi:MAG: leucine-rich repeat domain-containing protein, partial [Anaerovoracaceae bacterium]
MKSKLGKKLLALILCVPLLFSLASPLTAFGETRVYGIFMNDSETIYNCDSNGQNRGTTQIPLGDVTHLFIASDVDRVYNNSSINQFKNLVSLTIPPNVRVIEDTFGGSPKLENIDFSNATGLEEINGGVFSECPSLRTVDMSKAINLKKTGGSYNVSGKNFWNCANLETVILPKSLKRLAAYMFEGCKKLADVTFGSKIPPVMVGASFQNTKDKIRIHLPTGSNVKEWETALSRSGAS